MKKRIPLTIIFIFIVTCAYPQFCSKPKLVMADTIYCRDPIKIRLEKNDSCSRDDTYNIREFTVTFIRGTTLMHRSSGVTRDYQIRKYSECQPGDKITIQLTDAERVINGKAQNLPLGKWATITRQFH